MGVKQLYFILALLSLSCAVSAQDFFEEEEEEVLWFYDNKPRLTVSGITTATLSYYGTSVWIHHANRNFSTYFELKSSYDPEAKVTAIDKTGTSLRSASTGMLNIVSGLGIGSTIFENYLWYFNFGVDYTDYTISYNDIPDHKFKYTPPVRLHYGGGVATVLFDHLHLQAGIDMESFQLYGGAGFVF